ncbi:MAG: acyl carrier protein [Pelolinea sp.]|nr:acyl carrier protein [Pelolinea sp.]
MTINDQLIKVFREVFGDDSITLNPQTTANDIDGWDSLSHINLIIALEIAFGIEFTQEEIRSFKNVGDMQVCIEKKLK